MFKIGAWIQLILIVTVVGFATYQLFQGRFELALGTLPFLMAYYVFISARWRKKSKPEP